MTDDQVRAQAAAEGLTLVPTPRTGAQMRWLSVELPRCQRADHPLPYAAYTVTGDRRTQLGRFATGMEAALAVARHLGPEQSKALAEAQRDKRRKKQRVARPREAEAAEVCAAAAAPQAQAQELPVYTSTSATVATPAELTGDHGEDVSDDGEYVEATHVTLVGECRETNM